MSSILKIELRRAFINKIFLIALALGLCFAIAHLLVVVIPYGVGDAWAAWRTGTKGSYPFSVYNTWLGATGYSIFTTLYYFILPLIVCLPYADSLYMDITSGYAANVISRIGKTRYFAAKAIAVFLSAGIVAILPLVINFLTAALFVPLLMPDPLAGTFPVSPRSMFADLFYTAPIAYLCIFGMLTFVVAGIVACLCLVFSYLLANRFIVLIAPFLLCVISYFVLTGSGLAGYSPINLLIPAQFHHVQFDWVVAVYGTIAALSTAFIAWRAASYEAL